MRGLNGLCELFRLRLMSGLTIFEVERVGQARVLKFQTSSYSVAGCTKNRRELAIESKLKRFEAFLKFEALFSNTQMKRSVVLLEVIKSNHTKLAIESKLKTLIS